MQQTSEVHEPEDPQIDRFEIIISSLGVKAVEYLQFTG